MLLREGVRVVLFLFLYLESARTRRFAPTLPTLRRDWGRETALLAIPLPRRYQGRGFRGSMIRLENRYPLFGIMHVSPA